MEREPQKRREGRPMRDDDRIMRDVENIPEQTHREGRMAIMEQELGLVPLSGAPSIAGRP